MKIMVPSCVVRELYRSKRRRRREEEEEEDGDRDFSRFAYGLFTEVLATLSVLVVRIAPLEYSKIHEKAYKCIVCEFGGFLNVLRDACVRAIPT